MIKAASRLEIVAILSLLLVMVRVVIGGALVLLVLLVVEGRVIQGVCLVVKVVH